jgi:hypothetical protein
VELRLVRTPGQHDRAYIRLDDGQTRSWTFPSYGVMLPHDLVHLLVEVGFGVDDGFWGRVASGLDPAEINAEAELRGGKDKYAGFGADRSGLLLAEGYAGLPWSSPDLDDAALYVTLGENLQRMLTPTPPFDAARFAATRRALDAARPLWASLNAYGGTLSTTITLGPLRHGPLIVTPK